MLELIKFLEGIMISSAVIIGMIFIVAVLAWMVVGEIEFKGVTLQDRLDDYLSKRSESK